MAAIPDVAMTLALFGTRLSRVGITLSAPWSNLFRRTADRYLVDTETRLKTLLLSVQAGRYRADPWLQNSLGGTRKQGTSRTNRSGPEPVEELILVPGHLLIECFFGSSIQAVCSESSCLKGWSCLVLSGPVQSVTASGGTRAQCTTRCGTVCHVPFSFDPFVKQLLFSCRPARFHLI